MKKTALRLLAILLTLLPVLSVAEDYTIIRETKMLKIGSVIDDRNSKRKTVYYETASDCYNQKVENKETFYADAIICAAYDILYQIPDWNIQLISNLVEHTAYFGYSDKEGTNDLLFIFYQGSGNYAIADYVVTEHTLIVLNQTFSQEQILTVLNQLCTKYASVSQDELKSRYDVLSMVFAAINR